MAYGDWSTARQVGPYLDKGVLNSGIFDPSVHKVWMRFGIYAHLLLNVHRIDKAVLRMFLAKLSNTALRETCSTAAGGCFSNALVKLHGSVVMNPGHQLLMELNATHIKYMDMESLALQLLMRRLALGRATHEQRLMWETLSVLDEAQHREHDQDRARALCQIHGSVLANFMSNLPDSAAIYKHITQEVTNQVAVHATQHTIQDGAETGAGGRGASTHNTDTHTDDEQPQGSGDDDSAWPGQEQSRRVPRQSYQ